MPPRTQQTMHKTTASGLTWEAEYDGIRYQIRKRKQAKRITLRVASDGRVWVSIPLRAAVRDAEQFFVQNLDFVRSSLKKMADKGFFPKHNSSGNPTLFNNPPNTPPELLLPVDGVWKRLVIALREQYALEDFPEHVLISVPQQFATNEEMMRSSALRYWQYCMISRANALLPARTQELARTLGESVQRIAIKDQRSLWGSCVKTRRHINLNWRSILFPADVRDYLIIHELAHLRHANHSDAYWQHVDECCQKAQLPPYTLAERWIKANGRRIMSLRNVV